MGDEREYSFRNCDCCGHEKRTLEYFFLGNDRSWSRYWCEECLQIWKKSQKDLMDEVNKMENGTTSFWIRFFQGFIYLWDWLCKL
jgi:hypothetical protein